MLTATVISPTFSFSSWFHNNRRKRNKPWGGKKSLCICCSCFSVDQRVASYTPCYVTLALFESNLIKNMDGNCSPLEAPMFENSVPLPSAVLACFFSLSLFFSFRQNESGLKAAKPFEKQKHHLSFGSQENIWLFLFTRNATGASGKTKTVLSNDCGGFVVASAALW